MTSYHYGAKSSQNYQQTNRNLVISLGDFGLEVVSLLLPRLEVYRQFVACDTTHPRNLTRCGLIKSDQSNTLYAIADSSHQERAFTNVRDIQHYILHRQTVPLYSSVSNALEELLKLNSVYRSGVDVPTWLFELARPVADDLWKHTTGLAYLHVFLVVSIHEETLWSQILDLEKHLRTLQVPIALNIIVNIGAQDGDLNGAYQRATTKLRDFNSKISTMALLHRVYVIGHNKSNKALISSPGESAMVVCNYLDTVIFSNLADTLTEHYLPDEQNLLNNAPYSTFGVSKLYVPIAEVSSDIVARSVTRLMQERIQREPDAGQVNEQRKVAQNVADLLRLCRMAVMGLPITVRSRLNWWQRVREATKRLMSNRMLDARASRPHERKTRSFPERMRHVYNHLVAFGQQLRQQPETPEEAHQREYFQQCPTFKLRRSFLRAYIRASGARRTVEQWWIALQEFEEAVRQQHFKDWPSRIAEAQGISRQDEALVLKLANELTHNQLFKQKIQSGSSSDKAISLRSWIEDQRSDLTPIAPMLEKDVQEELLDLPQMKPEDIPAVLPNWLGVWLWRQRVASSGHLGEIYTQLREDLAELVAKQPLGLKLGLIRLQSIQNRYQHIQDVLKAWRHAHQVEQFTQLPTAYAQQLEQRKNRLVAAISHQPYPPAILLRLLMLWLIPLYMVVIGTVAYEWTPPIWLMSNMSLVVVAWTMGMIGGYIAIVLGSSWRVWGEQRRIEDLVLDKLNRTLEQYMYDELPNANSPDDKMGVIPTYLQAFERLMIKPGAGIEGVPESLLATFSGSVQSLAQHVNDNHVKDMPECVVYYPIAYVKVRHMLEQEIDAHLSNQPDIWGMQKGDVLKNFVSSYHLICRIRQTLKNLIMQHYLTTVKVSPQLQFHRLLTLPGFQTTEYRSSKAPKIDLDALVSDMNLRAKPFLDFSQHAYASVDFRETITALSASIEAEPLLLQPYARGREYRLLLNPTLELFGLSYAIIISGITLESLPTVPNHGSGIAQP